MQGSTSYEALQEAIDAVNFAEDAVLGVVMTHVDMNMGKFNRKYKYNTDYAYGENADVQSLEI